MFNKAVPDNLLDLMREEQAVTKAERELADRKQKLEEARKALDNSTPAHLLAITLHQKLCRWNHTDGCGWHYAVKNGIHDWDEHAHKEYLMKASQMMRQLECEPVTVKNVNDFVTKWL